MGTSTVSAMEHLVCVEKGDADSRVVVILLYSDVERKKAETLVHKMVKRAVELEGTVTVSRVPFRFWGILNWAR